MLLQIDIYNTGIIILSILPVLCMLQLDLRCLATHLSILLCLRLSLCFLNPHNTNPNTRITYTDHRINSCEQNLPSIHPFILMIPLAYQHGIKTVTQIVTRIENYERLKGARLTVGRITGSLQTAQDPNVPRIIPVLYLV